VWADFGDKFHIQKQEKISMSICVQKHLICELKIKMSSARFNAHLDTFHHGLPHPFQDAWVAVNSLASIKQWWCLFVVNRSCIYKGFQVPPTGKNPEDSNVVSIEVMQWVLLYLSIIHDRCY
jgi:hypothetical protein